MAIKLRGNTTMGMVNAGIADGNASKPKIGTTTTIGSANQPIKSTSPMMQDSFQKMIGGDTGIGSGGFYNSMAGLEAASMRFADAASQRNISEKQADATLKQADATSAAKAAGFGSPREMSEYNKKKREESDKEEKQAKYDAEMRRRGFELIGGRWVKRMA
jgi:hypothetical protein